MARTAVTTSAFPEADNAAPSGFTDLCDGAGAIEVLGNKYHSPFGFPADYRDNGTFTNKQYFKTRLSGFTGSGNTDEIGGLLFFGADIGTGRDGYRVYVRDGATKSLIVEKVVNAGITVLRTDTTQAWADSDFVEAEGDSSAGSSTTIRLFRNGTQLGTDLVDSSTPFTTGKPGLYAKQGANDSLRGDDYEAGDFTTGTPVGLATETDTALALSSPPAVGRANETDTALPLNGINFAQDGDLFLFGDDSGNESSMGGLRLFGGFIASGSSSPVGLGLETDTAVARGSARPAGVCTTTDTALALAGVQVRAAGLATESDQALALLPAANGAVGTAVESDVALARGAARPAGLAAESDAALALAGVAIRVVGAALESDVALALPARQVRAVGVAIESDAALALNSTGGAAVGLANELDVAVPRGVARPVTAAAEANVALALVPLQVRGVGAAVEVDTAISLGGSAGTAVGLAAESDAAVPRGSARPAGVSTEPESALGLSASLIRQAGLAAAADVALALTGIQRREVGLASEADSALRLFTPGAQAVGLALEIDVSLALQAVVIPPARRSSDGARQQLARTVPATTRRPAASGLRRK